MANIIISSVLAGTKLGGFARGFSAWGKENISKLAKREGAFMPVAIGHTADMLNLFAERSADYDNMIAQMVLPDGVAIKAYQLMGLLKNGATAEDVAVQATSEYDTEEHTASYVVLAEALENAKNASVQLRITRQSELSGFDLVVPEGVTLEEGQILTFKDGVTAEGVKFANGMKGDYSYPVATRHNGDLYAKRPETASSKAINALASKTFNLVREIPNRKVDDVSGVF